MKVKARLIEEPALAAAAIEVDASAGVVQLRGFVETRAQRELASRVVREVPGITRVDNRLEVK